MRAAELALESARRGDGRAGACSTRSSIAPRSRARRMEKELRARHRAAASCCCTTSRRSTWRPAGCWPSRRCCAGSTPSGALVPPQSFIPIAEASGLIRPIGAWVLAEACRATRRWHEQGIAIGISVNVSAAQLKHQDLAATVAQALAGHRPAAAGARAGADREHVRRSDPAGHAPRDAGGRRHGRAPRHRRFRHRLLVARLSEAAAGPQDQDRQVVRARARPRRRRRRDRPLDHRPGAAASANACWPRASRRRASSASCSPRAATRGRATISRARCRRPPAPHFCCGMGTSAKPQRRPNSRSAEAGLRQSVLQSSGVAHCRSASPGVRAGTGRACPCQPPRCAAPAPCYHSVLPSPFERRPWPATVLAREIAWLEPVAAFEAVRGLPWPVLLDSARADARLGRWSYVAADPFLRLTSKDGRITLGERSFTGDPFAVLQRALAHYRAGRTIRPCRCRSRPGRWAISATISAHHLERLPHPALDDLALPGPRASASTTRSLAFDHARAAGLDPVQRLARGDAGGQHASAQGAGRPAGGAGRPRAREPEPVPRSAGEVAHARPTSRRPAYEAAVQRVVDYILAGDIFQANLSQRFLAELPDGLDAWGLYRRLRRRNPAPFAAYLDFGERRRSPRPRPSGSWSCAGGGSRRGRSRAPGRAAPRRRRTRGWRPSCWPAPRTGPRT